MIECPSCRHQDFVGTLYCSECGTRLTHENPIPDGTTASSRASFEEIGTQPGIPQGPELESGAIMGLRVVETGEILSLLGRENYTLGRSGKNQAVIPDVDLLNFGAFDHGVSRIHAEILVRPEGIYLRDLDSANHTLINGHKLDPQESYPIHHGDMIELGGLRLQLISRYRI
jgi:hypothetical protein